MKEDFYTSTYVIFEEKFNTYTCDLSTMELRLREADCVTVIVVPSILIWSYVLWENIVGIAPNFQLFSCFLALAVIQPPNQKQSGWK